MATRRQFDARRGRTIQTTSTGGLPEPVPNDDEWTHELTGYFQNGGSSWTLWQAKAGGADDSGTASVSVGDLDISQIQLKTEAAAEPFSLGSHAEATANQWEIRVKARKRAAY